MGPDLCIVYIRVIEQGTQIKGPHFGSPTKPNTAFWKNPDLGEEIDLWVPN